MARSALPPLNRIRPLIRVIEPPGAPFRPPSKGTRPIADTYSRFRVYYTHWSLDPK
jgi:hypothetical protein